MKKWMKTLLASAMLSVACCFAFASAAFAEVYTGQNGQQFLWMFDSDTGVMRVELWRDDTLPSKDYEGWKQFSGKIKSIVEVSAEPQGGAVKGTWYGITWTIDKSTDTLTLKGKGEIPHAYWLIHTQLSQLRDHQLARLVFGDGITTVDAAFNELDARTVVLGKDVKGGNFSGLAYQSYELDAQNSWLTMYDGCVYTKDLTKLIACPSGKDYTSSPPELRIIGLGALDDGGNFQRVIPWGVTTVEGYVTTYFPPVFPNTVTSVQKGDHAAGRYVCSYYNKAVREAVESVEPNAWEYGYWGNRMYSYDSYYGIAANQWKTLNGQKYYFIEAPGWYGRPEARMVTGWYAIGNTNYFFDETGVLKDEKTITEPLKSQWQEKDGKRYYFDASGKKLQGWQQVDSVWYCFADDGAMRTNEWITWHTSRYFVRPGGSMAVNSWVKWGPGRWYYVEANGAMARNKCVERFGYRYYFDSSGVMAANTQTPYGWANADGHLTAKK